MVVVVVAGSADRLVIVEGEEDSGKIEERVVVEEVAACLVCNLVPRSGRNLGEEGEVGHWI